MELLQNRDRIQSNISGYFLEVNGKNLLLKTHIYEF